MNENPRSQGDQILTNVTQPGPRDRYRSIVTLLKPWCSNDEIDLHCSLLLMRDLSARSLRQCSDESHGIHAEIVRLATFYGAGSFLSVQNLAALRRILVSLTTAARQLEELMGHDDEPRKPSQP